MSSAMAIGDDAEADLVEASSSRCGSRRNKRKMTEPRRRATTDFSIRSICSSSNSDVDDDDDDDEREGLAGKYKRGRTEVLSKKPDTMAPSIRSADGDQLNLAVSTAAAVYAAAAAAAAFEQTKSLMFYPLSIPMMHCAPSVIPCTPPPGSFAALSSSYRNIFAMPPASPATKAAADASGERQRSPATDADIPSPTKDDDDRRSLLRRVDDEEEDNDNSRRAGLTLGNDRCPRRKRRHGGGSSSRRAASTVAAAGSSSVSPNISDGSPGRPTIASVERPTIEANRRDSSSSMPTAAGVVVAGSGVTIDAEGPSRATSPLRKNYKNMTKQRRIEANARERTRVHTISAAFESLRRAVPSYSYNQRLSKLAILRIACSYILALAKLADLDYGGSKNSGVGAMGRDSESLTFAECVDLCTQTIQTEGKAKRRQ